METGAPIDPTNQNTIPNVPLAPTQKKSNTGKIILIVLIVLLFLVGLPLLMIALVFGGIFSIIKTVGGELEESNKLTCTAANSALTVYYNSDDIIGVTTSGNTLKYDMDEIKSRLRGYGSVEDGLIAFGNSLVESSNGSTSCALNDIDVTELSNSGNNSSDTNNTTDTTVGVITPPSGWTIIPSARGTVYQGTTSDDLINIDTYDLSKATSLQDATQIYIDSNVFVFDEDLHISITKIGANRDIDAQRVFYDSIVFPSAAYIFKDEAGFHVIEFKTDDEDDLPNIEQVIYTYRKDDATGTTVEGAAENITNSQSI